MTVIISGDLVVPSGDDDLDVNSPIIGYENFVTVTNVSATTEDSDYPVSNLANSSTRLYWRAGAGSPSSEEYLTVELAGEVVDYLAIARHNLGSSQAAVSVEGVLDEPGSPADWFEIVSERLLSNDAPVIFRFNPLSLYSIRLRIQESQASTPVTPFAAVMYVGQLLVLQRRIYAGHTPIPYGRRLNYSTLKSVAGDFLGRVVLSETRETSLTLQNLTEGWFRTYFEPFLEHAETQPFFFNWRPDERPFESGFCWLTSDARPQNQQGVAWRSGLTSPNGLVQISLDLQGIV